MTVQLISKNEYTIMTPCHFYTQNDTKDATFAWNGFWTLEVVHIFFFAQGLGLDLGEGEGEGEGEG